MPSFSHLLVTGLLFPTLASAGEGPGPRHRAESDSVESEAPAPVSAEAPKERKLTYEVAFRVRRMTLPKRLLDTWYTDDVDKYPEWPIPGESRPFVNGMTYGLEMQFRSGAASGIVFLDYTDSNLREGYWDDADDPPNVEDGDYLDPTPNLGLLMVGADYQYEIPLVKPSLTKGAFQLDLHVGGGLGLAIMTGKFERWTQGEDDTPAYELYANGESSNSDKQINRFWPVVDVNAGLKFHFAKRVSLRLEGGIHTLLYYGATVGFQF